MSAFGPYAKEEVIDFEILNGKNIFLITGPTMTLAVGTTVIMRLGRKRYAWVTGVPCILMAIVAIAADYENVFYSYIPAGKWTLVVFSAAMFLMILIVLVEAVRSWIRLSNIPQDYRTQAEIEAESIVKYGKEAKA